MSVTPDNATLLPLQSPCSPFVARLYYVDQLVRNVLRQYFQSHPEYAMHGIRDLIWQPDNRSSGGENRPGTIRIDLAGAWTPSRADSVPAILVRRNDVGSVQLGIGDVNQFPATDVLGGTNTYTRAWVGSLTILCLSQLPRQLDLMAISVADHLQQFSKQLAKALNLKKVQVQQIGAIKPLREHPAILAAPVTVDYGLIETWVVRPEMRRLDKVDTRHIVT